MVIPTAESRAQIAKQFDAWGRFATLFLQFALIVSAIRKLQIESEVFGTVALLALGGFAVNHFLPKGWRMTWFAGLSIASVLIVFGLEQGAWLLGIGGILIGLCHVPVAFGVRLALVLGFAGALAAARIAWPPVGSAGIPVAIWPILGSMFMFRLITYLYDLKHEAAPFSPVRAITYFFMLPNVCFPLFPVVDYKTLQRSWFSEDPLRTYATGNKWMFRGLLQLLIYRAVYNYAVIDPSSVVTGLDAGRYMLATYLLYLKISGLFHVSVGMLHMFGFALPETHHLYLLSSSFTDYWRRINIYWKDFIEKLVFKPCFFALRRLGEGWAIGLATIIAFVATWFFHSYQSYWIRGTFPIVWSDLVFWLGLGAIVLVNVILESRRKKAKRTLKPAPRTLRDDVILGLKTAGMFVAILVLWTIWSTPEIHELKSLGAALMRSTPREIAIMALFPLAIGIAGVCFGRIGREGVAGVKLKAEAPRVFYARAATLLLCLAAMHLVARRPQVLAPISPRLQELAMDLSERKLNVLDTNRMQRGYYEDLGDAGRFNLELLAVYHKQPPGWGKTEQIRELANPIGYDYVPNSREEFKGAMRTINSHGMRDREYPVAKPAGTFRIGILGESHDAGSGVEDHQTYETIVEERLNRELGPVTGLKYEILNFSCKGWVPIQKLAAAESKANAFEPDLLIYTAYSREFDQVHRRMHDLVAGGHLEQFPFMADALKAAGVDGDKLPKKPELHRTLSPQAPRTLERLLTRFRDGCIERGTRPAMMLLSIPDDGPKKLPSFVRLGEIADRLGMPVVDTFGAFSKVDDLKSLWIFPWDSHTNVAGHVLWADHVYRQLVDQELVPTSSTTPRPAVNELSRAR